MTRPEDLLAAYASGDVTDDERAAVEAYVAAHPEARAELAAVHALLDETRAARPEPAAEPAWDDMRRAIRQAAAEPAPGPAARAWQWLLARPLATGALAVAAGAALALVVLRLDRIGDGVVVPAAPPPFADELPGLDEAWDADSLAFELPADGGFEDMFATGDDDDGDAPLDFRFAPAETDFDTMTDDELDAVADTFETGRPS
jgi:hypothetical protein